MEIREDIQLTGTPDILAERRPPIKLSQDPTIVVCVPIGGKNVTSVFTTPDGQDWEGVGFRAQALIPVHWAIANMQLVTALNTSMTYLMKFGMRSAQARQIMTTSALELNPEYILYWDDDVVPPANAIYVLHNFMAQNPDVGLVSAVYVTRNEPCEPLIYKEQGKGAYWGFEAGEGATPEDIFSCGAGFMLARASAVRKIIEQCGDVPIWADEHAIKIDPDKPGDPTRRIMWGHDVRFCKLMWETGYRVCVDGRVVCAHVDVQNKKLYTLPKDSLPYRNNPNYIAQVPAENASTKRKRSRTKITK